MYLSAVTVGWTPMESMKFLMQGLADVGELLWKLSRGCLLVLEGVSHFANTCW